MARRMTQDEIKAAYRLLSSICHPDVGGSHEAFVALGNLYELAKQAGSVSSADAERQRRQRDEAEQARSAAYAKQQARQREWEEAMRAAQAEERARKAAESRAKRAGRMPYVHDSWSVGVDADGDWVAQLPDGKWFMYNRDTKRWVECETPEGWECVREAA